MMYKEEVCRFDDSPDTVNYATFRHRLLPIVANKKNIDIDALMSKLAHFEELSHPEIYAHVAVSLINFHSEVSNVMLSFLLGCNFNCSAYNL